MSGWSLLSPPLRWAVALGVGIVLAAGAWGILYALPTQGKGGAASVGAGETRYEMRRFVGAQSRRDFSRAAFEAEDGTAATMERYRGQVVLVNLWATWCPPCREEMPTLARLQELRGGEGFQVVTIAVEDAQPAALREALAEMGADALPAHRDPRKEFSAALGAWGLPTSLLLDAEGVEIGRLAGPAKWDGAAALRLLEKAGVKAENGDKTREEMS